MYIYIYICTYIHIKLYIILPIPLGVLQEEPLPCRPMPLLLNLCSPELWLVSANTSFRGPEVVYYTIL